MPRRELAVEFAKLTWVLIGLLFGVEGIRKCCFKADLTAPWSQYRDVLLWVFALISLSIAVVWVIGKIRDFFKGKSAG